MKALAAFLFFLAPSALLAQTPKLDTTNNDAEHADKSTSTRNSKKPRYTYNCTFSRFLHPQTDSRMP